MVRLALMHEVEYKMKRVGGSIPSLATSEPQIFQPLTVAALPIESHFRRLLCHCFASSLILVDCVELF
jgi:hypothetical protein